jgi:hypothetical protein
MSRDHDAVDGEIKAVICFVIQVIADEDTSCGMRSNLMWGYHRKVGVASKPKDPKVLIGRRCVV